MTQEQERKVRKQIRVHLLEYYAQNGLDDLTPKEVQRRLAILEAKVINSTPKMNKKMLGSAKTIGNTANNADWVYGKKRKAAAKEISLGGKGEKIKGKSIVKNQKIGPAPKFTAGKGKPSKKFGV